MEETLSSGAALLQSLFILGTHLGPFLSGSKFLHWKKDLGKLIRNFWDFETFLSGLYPCFPEACPSLVLCLASRQLHQP